MRDRLIEKLAAVICALCLAGGVMSGVVLAKDEEPTLEPVADPEATAFVIVDETPAATPLSEAEITDNRTTVPCVVGGQTLWCTIVNGVPYVDAAAFCAALDVGASAYHSGGVLNVRAEGLDLTAAGGDLYFVCNDRYLYALEGVMSSGGQVLLPLDQLTKALGIPASWDRTLWVITVDGDELMPLVDGEDYYSDTDVYWLSRVIYAEAGNQPLRGQIAVGNVVLNRMADEDFADQDTVYDVIFAKNQFDVVVNGMIYMEPDAQSRIAAKLALEGYDVVGDATYFATFDFGDGYECVAWIGDHCFMTGA